MTKDQYLRMVEQTGEEIDWDKCPPELNDFPTSILTALNIFHSLGNRIYPDVGFVGKDYTNLPLLFDFYGVEEHEKEYIFELLLFIDNKTQEDSRKRIKAEYDKLKKK